jgi:hypothetical protein
MVFGMQEFQERFDLDVAEPETCPTKQRGKEIARAGGAKA